MTANCAGDNQKQEIAREGESHTGRGHQDGAYDKHAPPPDAIGASGEIKGDYRVSGEGQGKKQASLRFAESEANQIKNQDDQSEP